MTSPSRLKTSGLQQKLKITYLIAELQIRGFSIEHGEMKEDFLFVFRGFDEAERLLQSGDEALKSRSRRSDAATRRARQRCR